MGRWMPDAQGRMVASALELYAEQGFEATTALEIAERAGVTERTFFRHFADKREVLFLGANVLVEKVVEAITEAPVALSPLAVVVAAMERGAALIDDRARARRRAAVIAANPGLMERELLKMATMASSSAEALRARGVEPLAATLAAEAGVALFRTGFDAWIGEGEAPAGFAGCIRAAYAELRALTA